MNEPQTFVYDIPEGDPRREAALVMLPLSYDEALCVRRALERVEQHDGANLKCLACAVENKIATAFSHLTPEVK